MSWTIAVAGKGGTGKTTISALIVRHLLKTGAGPILAIDADPNSTLAEAIGLTKSDSIADIMEEVRRNIDSIPKGMTKERFIEYRVQESISESKGVDLLTMGRPEGPGCYCYINDLLRSLIKKLISNYPFIVIDNEAGMEHVSRRIVANMDSLLLVSDYSLVGVRSAVRIFKLIKELGISVKANYMIINKVHGALDGLKRELPSDITLAGTIPYDESLVKLALEGKAVGNGSISQEVMQVINEICTTIRK
ncbi:MAG: AAA family ATPase [Candidatus Omnitrophica bacterium]|nr:AAA family ATPase [Candidatus Omnitrophota bacterium]